MRVDRIYHGFQSEGTQIGVQSVFIKIVPCGFSCNNCYSDKQKGTQMSVDEIIERMGDYSADHICLIGGEPLFWEEESEELIDKILLLGYKVNLNTNGTFTIPNRYFYDKRIVVSLNIKCPSSGTENALETSNLRDINKKDEVKFFISDDHDYMYAAMICDEYLFKKHTYCRPQIFFYPTRTSRSEQIAQQINEDKLNVRLGIISKEFWEEKRCR